MPVRARGILRHRRGLGPRIEGLLAQLGISDRGLPPAQNDARSAIDARVDEEPLELTNLAEIESPLDEPPPGTPMTGSDTAALQGAEHENDIGTLLRRIEEFSRTRREGPLLDSRRQDAPPLPLEYDNDENQAENVLSFDFATDAEGRIASADPAIAPMVVGIRLVASDQDGALTAPADAMATLRHRQPLRNIPVSISGAPAVGGNWQIDAAPRFDPKFGGFAGYAGRFRRPAAALASDAAPKTASPETDRIRQILHELRTPANAIQISAEIIQQNLFGPTPHEYRAIAAMIASDTAYVLAGFDELERLAKLEGNAIEIDAGTSDITAVTGMIVDQLQAYSAKRESGFAFKPEDTPIQIALVEMEAERLVWRLLAVLAGETAPNEQLALSCALEDDRAVLVAELPAALATHEDEALFQANAGGGATHRALSAGMFGTGFSLRLARAEAKAAGGSLKRDGHQLRLILPALTAHSAAHDQV